MIESIKKLIRATNYLSVAQLYLQDNFLLERPLVPNDIKPRLHGHWGSVPGVNFIYAHLNALIIKHNASILFVLGPGHAFPGVQSNLFVEGTLREYYPKAQQNTDGIAYISKLFSWPYGFPSHCNPGTPGVILEGGELGYSLSTSYGTVLDNPDLIVACVVGDGEAETGPLAASWHINKLIDPATSGAVLPILHLNGYKISGPTLMGRMTNRELKSLFYGYGYDPILIDGSNLHEKMSKALEYSYEKIRSIQESARSGGKTDIPRFPMLILKTPKGLSGIKWIGKDKIEGNCLSHQVVYTDARTNKKGLKAIEKWLESYKFNELFDAEKGFIEEINSLIPKENLRMGKNQHAIGGNLKKDLVLPDPAHYKVDMVKQGTINASSMEAMGHILNEVFQLNEKTKNFRMMSPDETYSNKIDAIFSSTKRAFMLPIKPWDKDLSPDGRMMEILSEHCLQGLMEGYVLTGRHAVFVSYEAFIEVVSSMVDQYAKFIKASQQYPWRTPISSLNIVLTSPGWRQDHNGYSHQNPGFVSSMLDKHHEFVQVFFPSDANTTLVVINEALRKTNGINILTLGKTQEPQWRTLDEAKKEFERGYAVWDFASDENPDIVMCGVGDYLTTESLAAITIIKSAAPSVKIRFVNILELTVLGIGKENYSIDRTTFNEIFTEDKPVIFNFYGYPNSLRQAISGQHNAERFSVHGYIDQGSTTTPFDMQVRNKTSRFDLAIEAMQMLKLFGTISGDEANNHIQNFEKILRDHREYVERVGDDMELITNWQWQRTW